MRASISITKPKEPGAWAWELEVRATNMRRPIVHHYATRGEAAAAAHRLLRKAEGA